MQLSKPLFSIARHNPWRENLVGRLPNEWHCGAGPPPYICEDGLVLCCVAQCRHPAIPLSRYTRKNIERESKTKSRVVPTARFSAFNRWRYSTGCRKIQDKGSSSCFSAGGEDSREARLPVPIRVLSALSCLPVTRLAAGSSQEQRCRH